MEWRLEDGTGGGGDKSSRAFFRASSGDLQSHTRTRIGRTFDSLHLSQHCEVSSSTSHSGNGLLSGLGSEQKQHFGSFFTRVLSASNWAQHEHGLPHIHAFLRRVGFILCMFVENTQDVRHPFSPIPFLSYKCHPSPKRRSAGTVRGVVGCIRWRRSRVTIASITASILRSRKSVLTAAARDT